MVSNRGRIRSLDRYVDGRNCKRLIKGKIIKTYVDKNGYERVDLSRNNRRKKAKVHRVVLSSFTGKNIKLDVNHKDCNKLNNNLDNLEWCTRSENLIHAVQNGLNNQCIGIVAERNGEKIYSKSIYGLYDIISKKEHISTSRHCFGNNVLRALNKGSKYYGFVFRKESEMMI